jgi:hypothetical protein
MSNKLPNLTNLATPALTDLFYIVTPGIEPLGSFNISFAQLRAELLSGVGIAQPIDTTTYSSAAGGALTTFATYNITLPSNGDYFKFFYGGAYAANANTKRVTLTVGGNAYEDTGLIDIRTLGWVLSGVVTRLTDTTVRAVTVFDGGILAIDGANAIVATNIGGRMNQRVAPSLTVADLDTNPLVMVTSGAGTAAADVTQVIGMNEIVQF